MEWRDKTWSDETGFTTPRFIIPCFITPHQILSYATFTMASTTTVCDYISRLYKMMPFIPQLLFFLTCDFFFLTFFLSSVTEMWKRI